MNLLKTSFWVGLSTVLRMCAGLITTKIMAIYVGPSGVALLGNFTNVTGIISNLSNGATATGVTKYIAEYDKEEEKQTFIANALKITLFCSLIISVFIISMSGYLSVLILKSKEYQSVFIILGFSLAFFGLNTTFIAILSGYKKIKNIIVAGMLSNVIGVILAIVFTVRFGLYGALLNSIISQLFSFVIYIIIISRAKIFDLRVIKIKFNKVLSVKLFKYATMSIVSVFVVPIGLLLIRNYVIHSYSASEAGLLQGVWSLSSVYLSVIIMILSIYFMPTLSSIKEREKLRSELLHTLKFILILSFLGLLTVFICQDIIINILFTAEFLPMQKYFTFHIIGDFFRIASLVLEYVLVAKAMVRWYIVCAIGTSGLYVVLSFVFMIFLGSIGETYAYCLSYFLYLMFLIILFKDILFKVSTN